MTRKHYILIASIIDSMIASEHLCPATAVYMASRFEAALRNTNPHFDGQKFYAACTKSLPMIEEKYAEACS
tara:strand:+ start:630 stop:842 length:213 start_codon:yes stop_codon:yes gene_type:complete